MLFAASILRGRTCALLAVPFSALPEEAQALPLLVVHNSMSSRAQSSVACKALFSGLRASSRKNYREPHIAVCVMHSPLEIDDDRGLVSDHRGVVARGEHRYITGLTLELGSVVHSNPRHIRHVILKVRGLGPLVLAMG